jgi:competence/damage-inducible protein CinA-like protein
MVVELINTGSELMLGRVLNSHQQWLCRQLADRGYVVSRQVAVADSAPEIAQAVREALSRADLVIATGGLGPTSDDLTRDAIAGLLGKKLYEDAAVIAHIRNLFAQRRRPMLESMRVQALVPEGALVLGNSHGTAPGLAVEIRPNPFRNADRPAWLIMLPGPTRELRPLFAESVVPLLQRVFPLENTFVCRTLRTIGMGESMVEEKIAKPLGSILSRGVQIGYCAAPGRVDIRLSAAGTNADQLIAEGEGIIRTLLGNAVFSVGDEELEAVVIRLLTERKQTLAVAESCTGGYVAHRLTNVSGASAVLRAGWVTYSNEAKQQSLGVQTATLAQYGAVSEPVAREMAEGARRIGQTDFAIATTGIAGPTGGTPEKPVGTVFIALASSQGTQAWKFFNAWDRTTFKEVTTQQALNQLRLLLG